MTTRQRWFRRRGVGLGSRPVTWQGWLITLTTLALVVAVLVLMHASPARIPLVILLLGAYAVVALLTGGAASAADPAVEQQALVEPVQPRALRSLTTRRPELRAGSSATSRAACHRDRAR